MSLKCWSQKYVKLKLKFYDENKKADTRKYAQKEMLSHWRHVISGGTYMKEISEMKNLNYFSNSLNYLKSSWVLWVKWQHLMKINKLNSEIEKENLGYVEVR